MTAFNGWFTNEKYIIATDTLCGLNTPYGKVYKNFLTKIYHIPQYKCCFTSQGLRDFGLELFVFIQKETKAIGYSTLIESIKNFELSNAYDEMPPDMIGTVFLFGVNDVTNRLGMSKIYFNQNREIIIEEIFNNIDGSNKIYKPQHENIDLETLGRELNWSNINNVYNSLITVTKEQKKAFDKEANPFIGGQIEITTIEYSNNLYSTFTEIAYDFEDYERISSIILK
jgi:hypothetical protein